MLGSYLLQAEAFLPRGKREVQDSGANLTSKAQELDQLWNPHCSSLGKNSITCCREETLSIELLASHTAWLRSAASVSSGMWEQALGCPNCPCSSMSPFSHVPERSPNYLTGSLSWTKTINSLAQRGKGLMSSRLGCGVEADGFYGRNSQLSFKFSALGRSGALRRTGLHLWRTDGQHELELVGNLKKKKTKTWVWRGSERS